MVCVFARCATSNGLLTQNDSVKLTINTPKETISDTVNVIVTFENNTTEDFYLINKRFTRISADITFMWNLKIFFQDTIPMIIPQLINHGRVQKEDYILVKSGDKYVFDVDVNFRKLIRKDSRDYRKFTTLNSDYGEYSLQLNYKDPFLVHKQAFRGKVESNEVKVMYRK